MSAAWTISCRSVSETINGPPWVRRLSVNRPGARVILGAASHPGRCLVSDALIDYAHVMPGNQRDAANRLARLIWEASA